MYFNILFKEIMAAYNAGMADLFIKKIIVL